MGAAKSNTLVLPVAGVKADSGKPMPRLLFGSLANEVIGVIDVLTYGATKYSPDNWKYVEPSRYWDALFRHLLTHLEGVEKNDPESGLSHLAHACCNLLFLMHLERETNEPKV